MFIKIAPLPAGEGAMDLRDRAGTREERGGRTEGSQKCKKMRLGAGEEPRRGQKVSSLRFSLRRSRVGVQIQFKSSELKKKFKP